MAGYVTLEIMDTTLRDGEQTAGVSFNAEEKLAIARMLFEDLRVNRIEVVSARVSNGELRAFEKICDWASRSGYIDRVEALGFVDGGRSIEWISQAGGKVLNLLAKGSLKHVTTQLGKTPQEHWNDIRSEVARAIACGLRVNLYLEDWSNGMLSSPDYVFGMMDALKDSGIGRFMLPDTLGILNPQQTFDLCTEMVARYPDLHFDFHGHNDYDLAVANTMAAVRAGVSGVHVSVNGLGERTGNTPVASVVCVLNDHLNVPNTVDESQLTQVCRYVESISGIRIPDNRPVIGDAVFTQSAGIHADGDKKGHLYENPLLPERFGRVRKYALGKTSGKANIAKNLEELGIRLTPEQLRVVTARVVELGDRKESVTTEDLPFIISDVLKGEFSTGEDKIRVVNYSLQLTRSMRPVAMIRISIEGQEYEEVSSGAGQYDAFMKALWKVYDRLGKPHPRLVDYTVSIPPGGKTDALVQAAITWDWNSSELKTKGLDADQTEAAIKATFKMLNIIENIKQ
ncbi:MAG: 2-isopropylmalate synthase [Bacteroidales bacterium]|nr:2-isopropylmalate synthase [Bacteroidales bacterium]